MTLDEYLDEKKGILDRIKYKESRIHLYELKANSCTVRYDPMAGYNATRNLHPMEDAVIEIIELQNEVKSLKAELTLLNERFRKSIKQIDDVNCRIVLEMKYIDDKTWDDIRAVMHYSRAHLFRIRSKGEELLMKTG